MTYTFTKKIIACAVLSTTALASNAHAGNTVNKFAENIASTQQLSTPHTEVTPQAKASTKTFRVKRIVKAVPKQRTNSLSFASEHNTVNKRDGFNKMVSKANDKSVVMPTFVDRGALTAR